MKQTGRLASFYTAICNEKDAERVLSDLSIFWYAYGVILIAILLIITILTKEKVSLYFPIILLFAGYFLSGRKSRVLSSFILFYSLGLIGFVIWFFTGLTTAYFPLGLCSSLVIIVLTLCSWSACRSVMATFIYHKKTGSQIFLRNIFLACGFVLVLPLVVPLPYAFSEIPWQHINHADTYKYFTEELLIYTVSALIALIIFIILTHYLPLVDWTNANSANIKIQKRFASLYTPILNKNDAEIVLSDLSIFWYVFAVFLSIFAVVHIISSERKLADYIISIIFPVIFLFAGYFLPRRKSRVLSLVILAYSLYVAVVSTWYFLYMHPPEVGLWLVTMVSSLTLLIPLLAALCTWAAYRSTIATFVYNRHL